MDLGALTSGLLTGLREGVEAALIVAIVVAYLVRTGNAAEVRKVWLGAGLAVVASFVAGLAIFATVGTFQEPYEQIFEGSTMLLGATVVTWMLFWMRRQSRALRGDLEARLDRTIGEGSALGLAVLAFTAVIREGLETALFLVGQATSAAADASSVLVGALFGLVGAAAIGWAIYRGSRRIDLRSFFTWTGASLIFIAAGLLASAVHEFIEIGVIGFGTQTLYDLSGVLPDDAGIGAFAHVILGYSAQPALTTMVVYVGYLAIVLWAYLRPSRLPRARPRSRRPSSAGSRRSAG